jgi:hypothetical protein
VTGAMMRRALAATERLEAVLIPIVVDLAVGAAPPAHLAHIPTAVLAEVWGDVLTLCASLRAMAAEEGEAGETPRKAERLAAMARKAERLEVKLRRLVAAGGAL